MLQLKKLWSYLTGFVFLILSVTPAIAQFDTSVPTAICLIGNNPGHRRLGLPDCGDVGVR